MRDLPRRPRAKAGLFEIIDYLADMAEFLGEFAVVSLFEGSKIMATVAELQTVIDANQAATDAAVTAIQTEIAQLQAAIDALSTATPPTQAQLDQLTASTAKLTAATAALAADDPASPTP